MGTYSNKVQLITKLCISIFWSLVPSGGLLPHLVFSLNKAGNLDRITRLPPNPGELSGTALQRLEVLGILQHSFCDRHLRVAPDHCGDLVASV